MNIKEETLIILMEECGEVIQSASKIIRFGDSPENIKNFEKEIGDLFCMIGLLKENGIIDLKNLEKDANSKLTKLKKYSNITS